LSPNEIRIMSRKRPATAREGELDQAWLERLPSKQVSPLRGGTVINELYLLFNGSPEGDSSQDDTYVNSLLVADSGRRLADGDVIVLAQQTRCNRDLTCPKRWALYFAVLEVDYPVCGILFLGKCKTR
jgi:hypothetical protein